MMTDGIQQMKMAATVASSLAFFLLVMPISTAFAHGGGLNAQGCHNQKSNGTYHCHRSQAAPQAVAPARSGSGAFVNCTAARAAGAAPVLRGSPGYGPHLDRDNDGIGCE